MAHVLVAGDELQVDAVGVDQPMDQLNLDLGHRGNQAAGFGTNDYDDYRHIF